MIKNNSGMNFYSQVLRLGVEFSSGAMSLFLDVEERAWNILILSQEVFDTFDLVPSFYLYKIFPF